jgi:two-component sensor histidine kinase
LGSANRDRVRIVVFALSAWFALNLVFDIVAFVPAGKRFYLWFDLTVLPIFIGTFVWLQARPKPLAVLWITSAFGCVLLVSTAVLSVVQGSALTFIIACYLLASTAYMQLWVAAMNYVLALTVYVIGVQVSTGHLSADIVHLIEIAAAVLFAFVVSRVLFRERLKAYIAAQEVGRLTESQERTIQERTGELTTANARLETRLREREVLVQEIHHRVNNNLQVLASLMHLARNRAQELSVQWTFSEMEMRILSMAMVHQRLHETDVLERIQLADYLSDLVDEIRQRFGSDGAEHVRVRKDFVEAEVDIDRAVHIGLIATEVITNCFTHGFRGNRTDYELLVACTETDRELTLTISDNGEGTHQEITADRRSGTGLGLLVVQALVEQEGGTYSYAADHGTTFTLTAPRT